jgi:putative DNA primase/helicase
MSWANYEDVLAQMRGIGLLVDTLDTGRMQRCKVEGDRERRGWYMLHELRLDDGDMVLVGGFGRWQGNENNAQKIDIAAWLKNSKRSPMTSDQAAALKKRMLEDRKRADAYRAAMAATAARRAKKVWDKLLPVGECQYLVAKGVQAHGLRFSESGCAYVPMLDAGGNLHGLQILLPKGHPRIAKIERNKDFWPPNLVKKGHWFQIGAVHGLVLVAEGYATAASIHEATGLPVAVAFDSGNMLPVAEALRRRHSNARILVCADDDETQKCQQSDCRKRVWLADGPTCPHCGKPHKASNAGLTAAATAVLSIAGARVAPSFADPAKRRTDWLEHAVKLNDFNDLHLAEGLHTVRAQLESRLDELGWRSGIAAAPAGATPQGGGERAALKSMLTIDEAVERFALVFGGKGTLFDHQEHILVPKNDVLDILPEHGWRDMRSRKQVVRMDEVGFDPAGTDKRITCNLWSGWPTKPVEGTCDKLLELLEYLCGQEDDTHQAFYWVLKWVAYPVQHPGAKMRTALVFHGPQGTGKNLFFESVMAVYGEYGRIVDQSAVEDKFNDWASKKLFMIADEVVARQELFHVKNKLKGLVTGTSIRINPKNVAAHDESNHVNLVFLSNESQPLVLEKDDRRYTVIHTPEKLSEAFYQDVRDEINAGGIAALHHYLLQLDLGDFDEHTKPPMTQAKQALIEVSLDSVQRFLNEWQHGEVKNAHFVPCLGSHLYTTYKKWCEACGERSPRSLAQFIGTIKNLPRWRAGQPLQTWETLNDKTAKNRKMVIPPDDLLATYADPVEKGDKTQANWLTACFFKFAQALELE